MTCSLFYVVSLDFNVLTLRAMRQISGEKVGSDSRQTMPERHSSSNFRRYSMNQSNTASLFFIRNKKESSLGARSGEYGGYWRSSNLHCWIAVWVIRAVCAGALSHKNNSFLRFSFISHRSWTIRLALLWWCHVTNDQWAAVYVHHNTWWLKSS